TTGAEVTETYLGRETVRHPLYNRDVAVFKICVKAIDSGLRQINRLPVIPLSTGDKIYNELVERGKQFVKYAINLVSGKGDGCTFLLYGPPGVGKTLTVEAIAEMLHRPLYFVTVGELGTNARDLEKNLMIIFKRALAWNAIILIDEDIKKLSKKHLNGRDIKNAALNVETNKPITTKLLEEILNTSSSKILECNTE
ncbi:2891_t:CDS:2, partial [Racocetra fulgida]